MCPGLCKVFFFFKGSFLGPHGSVRFGYLGLRVEGLWAHELWGLGIGFRV